MSRFTIYYRSIKREDGVKVSIRFECVNIGIEREYIVSVEFLTVERSVYSANSHITRETEIRSFECREDASNDCRFQVLMHFNSVSI